MRLEPSTIGDVAGGADNQPAGRIGVVDLGSNSGRLVVYDQYGSGYLSIVEDARVPLRLAGDLQRDGRLGQDAVERTVDALREFTSIANGAGAERLIVVGTAAMREAENGEEFLRRVERLAGTSIEILDGLTEALYSFLGAIHGLPVWNGYVLDIGGGSLELTRFRERRGIGSWTLPLGALRTSVEFLKSDPPTGKEVRGLKKHIVRTLEEAGVPEADVGDFLVGTGGTIRNVAKIDRKRHKTPIQRLHGYSLPFQRVRRVVSHVSTVDAPGRASTPGLNADRADSIAGGAIAVETVMESLGMDELLVSGKGLREGIAYALTSAEPPDPERVKRSSVAALAARFRAWDAERAEQRVAAVSQLGRALNGDAAPSFLRLCEFAAYLLDIGRSVDYYNRLSHTANVVQVADLDGFTHREIALLATIIREADQPQPELSQFEPLVTQDDTGEIARCGVILLVADEIERRYPSGAPVQLTVTPQPDSVMISIPSFSNYGVARLGDRFQRVFGRQLIFT